MTCLLIASVGIYPAGCGGGGDGGASVDAAVADDALSGPPVVFNSSFSVSADITFDGTPDRQIPDQVSFVLSLQDSPQDGSGDAGVTVAIVGSDVSSPSTAAFAASSGRVRSLTDQYFYVRARALMPSTEPCKVTTAGFTFDSVDIIGHDDDGDGDADRITGSAAGVGFFIPGDVPLTVDITATFSGSRDETPPTVAISSSWPAAAELPSTNDLQVVVDEPVSASVSAHLVSAADGTVVPLESVAPGQPVRVFAIPEGVSLPMGASYTVGFEPALTDLAGNPSAGDLPEVSTLAPPVMGLAIADFEGDGGVTLSGNAELRAAVGSVSALAGARSLVIGPAGHAAVRLTVPDPLGDDPRLRLLLRPLAPRGYFTTVPSAADIRVIIPNLDQEVVWQLPADDSASPVDTGDDAYPLAGAMQTAEISLPAGVAGEIIVAIRSPDYECDNTFYRASFDYGVMLDDIALISGTSAQRDE
ncbi:MAG: hypothetical protein Tsb0020_42760 [Haliangiales bacterium]